MSVFMFNSGTWGSLLKSEFRYFEKRLHSLYRGLARGDIPELELRLWSNERVRAFVQLPSAGELLHGARLRYSVSLYSSGPRTLWTLIGAEKCWVQEIDEAHNWFFDQLKGYGPDGHGNPWRPDLHQWRKEDKCTLSKWGAQG